jgi:stress response protein YsnF
MALLRLEDFDPNYQTRLGAPIHSFDVYLSPQERLGHVVDAWVDEIGNLQNLIVDVGSRATSKRIMVPFGQSQVDRKARRIYINGLTRSQIDDLSERQQRATPQGSTYQVASLEDSASLESPRVGYMNQPVPAYPVEPPPAVMPNAYVEPAPLPVAPVSPPLATPINPVHPTVPVSDRQPTYSDDNPKIVEQKTIPLREERLIVDHRKQKMGEVVVRKEIETEIIEVPIQREKLIVEQVGKETRRLAEIDLHDEPGKTNL